MNRPARIQETLLRAVSHVRRPSQLLGSGHADGERLCRLSASQCRFYRHDPRDEYVPRDGVEGVAHFVSRFCCGASQWPTTMLSLEFEKKFPDNEASVAEIHSMSQSLLQHTFRMLSYLNNDQTVEIPEQLEEVVRQRLGIVVSEFALRVPFLTTSTLVKLYQTVCTETWSSGPGTMFLISFVLPEIIRRSLSGRLAAELSLDQVVELSIVSQFHDTKFETLHGLLQSIALAWGTTAEKYFYGYTGLLGAVTKALRPLLITSARLKATLGEPLLQTVSLHCGKNQAAANFWKATASKLEDLVNCGKTHLRQQITLVLSGRNPGTALRGLNTTLFFASRYGCVVEGVDYDEIVRIIDITHAQSGIEFGLDASLLLSLERLKLYKTSHGAALVAKIAPMVTRLGDMLKVMKMDSGIVSKRTYQLFFRDLTLSANDEIPAADVPALFAGMAHARFVPRGKIPKVLVSKFDATVGVASDSPAPVRDLVRIVSSLRSLGILDQQIPHLHNTMKALEAAAKRQIQVVVGRSLAPGDNQEAHRPPSGLVVSDAVVAGGSPDPEPLRMNEVILLLRAFPPKDNPLYSSLALPNDVERQVALRRQLLQIVSKSTVSSPAALSCVQTLVNQMAWQRKEGSERLAREIVRSTVLAEPNRSTVLEWIKNHVQASDDPTGGKLRNPTTAHITLLYATVVVQRAIDSERDVAVLSAAIREACHLERHQIVDLVNFCHSILLLTEAKPYEPGQPLSAWQKTLADKSHWEDLVDVIDDVVRAACPLKRFPTLRWFEVEVLNGLLNNHPWGAVLRRQELSRGSTLEDAAGRLAVAAKQVSTMRRRILNEVSGRGDDDATHGTNPAEQSCAKTKPAPSQQQSEAVSGNKSASINSLGEAPGTAGPANPIPTAGTNAAIASNKDEQTQQVSPVAQPVQPEVPKKSRRSKFQDDDD